MKKILKSVSDFFKNLFKNLKKDKWLMAIIALAVVALILGIILLIHVFKNDDPYKEPTIVLVGGSVDVGKTIDVPLEFHKNSGSYVAGIYLEYDAENLSFVSYDFNTYDNGGVFDLCYVDNSTPGTLSIIFEMNNDKDGNPEISKNDGTAVTLKFKAKVSAEEGDYELKFSNDRENGEVYCMVSDENSNEVEFNFEGATITIE